MGASRKSIKGDVKRNISPQNWVPCGSWLGIQPHNSMGGWGDFHPLCKRAVPTNGRPVDWMAPVLLLPFSLWVGEVLQNGPEQSRARRKARRSEPWTARTVLEAWGRGKRSCRRGRFLKRDKRGGGARVSTRILFET